MCTLKKTKQNQVCNWHLFFVFVSFLHIHLHLTVFLLRGFKHTGDWHKNVSLV